MCEELPKGAEIGADSTGFPFSEHGGYRINPERDGRRVCDRVDGECECGGGRLWGCRGG